MELFFLQLSSLIIIHVSLICFSFDDIFLNHLVLLVCQSIHTRYNSIVIPHFIDRCLSIDRGSIGVASAIDAFATVSALFHILSSSGSGRWAKWRFDADMRVILAGHSNGGQGTWHMEQMA